MALPQDLNQWSCQTELGEREPLKGGFKIDDACRGGISEHTCRAGDAKSQRRRNAPSALFIHDQQAAPTMLPGEGNRRSFSWIKRARFLKAGLYVSHNHEPRLRIGDELVQGRRGTGLKCFLLDGRSDGDRAIKLAKHIQFPQFSQTGESGGVTDDDHERLARKRAEVSASWRISSAV